ncbi:TPA: phage tail protein [Yersinia enterocolitica]|nr:phage tail protein [Yersinia enterocolitica]HEI6832130.1 phage tail protein [Yersinia enterocolitica]HEI6939558.1 phage tail protein [Yersinia enterocolitica]
MTAKFFALLTNIGAAKLANATALGTRLEITHMAVGDGGGTLPTPNPAQTQLVNEQRCAALNTLSIDPINTSQIIAEQVIPEAEGGWWIREIGLLDKDGDLVAIANCAETYKPLMQEGSGRTQTIRVILIVSSTAAVTLKIDPSVVLATRKYADDKAIEVKQYADKLLADHEKSRNHPDASLTAKGFVKLSSAITSDSEVLAATPKAVKTVADNAGKAMDDHGKAENPHSQYLQMGQLTGVVGASRNAKMSVTAASVTATFTADEIIVQTALGGEQYKLSNFNKIINLAASGAGGMDTGTVPVIGFVALYAIYNPITHASALLAVNATLSAAPEICAGVLPPNYTASALVGVQPIEAGKFKVCLLTGRHVSFPRVSAISTSSSTSNAVVRLSVSVIIPKNAVRIGGVIYAGGGSTTISYSSVQVGGDSNMCGAQEVRLGVPASTGSDVVGNYIIDINDPQALYYILNTTMNGAVLCSIFISRYSF